MAEKCPGCKKPVYEWSRPNDDWEDTPDGCEGDIECGYCGYWLGNKEITESIRRIND